MQIDEDTLQSFGLTEADIAYFEQRGKSLGQVRIELDALKGTTLPLEVQDSARFDNHYLWSISLPQMRQLLNYYETHVRQKELTFFVPAAGAASRQFQLLKTVCYHPSFAGIDRTSAILERANQRCEDLTDASSDAERAEYKQMKEVLERLPRFWSEGIEQRKFAFIDALDEKLSQRGQELAKLIDNQAIKSICLGILETEKGLGYSFLPKALLLFHAYPTDDELDESRTALEEHIRALVPLFAGFSKIRLHLAISEEHEEPIKACLREIFAKTSLQAYLTEHDRSKESFEIKWSFQAPSTDAIALDLRTNTIARTSSGEPLVRKAGHGALIENVAQLDADGIWIQNIDNILYDHPPIRAAVCTTKKLMAALAFQTQEELHQVIRELHKERTEGRLTKRLFERVKELVEKRLHMRFVLPLDFETGNAQNIEEILALLDRPLVIGGYVPLRPGQKGGGPFVLKQTLGQIEVYKTNTVEGSEFAGGQEHPIFQSGSCFNPVNLFVTTERYDGSHFDLRECCDQARYFLSEKTDPTGTPIKAYERPGLWNGALALALQISIGTLACTFGAVKDTSGPESFLSPLHQPGTPPVITPLDLQRGIVDQQTAAFFRQKSNEK